MPKQQASVLRYCSSLQILLFYMYYTDQEAEKAILVGVALQSEGITYEQMTEYLDELSFLAETAGAETVKIFTQNLDKPVHARVSPISKKTPFFPSRSAFGDFLISMILN